MPGNSTNRFEEKLWGQFVTPTYWHNFFTLCESPVCDHLDVSSLMFDSIQILSFVAATFSDRKMRWCNWLVSKILQSLRQRSLLVKDFFFRIDSSQTDKRGKYLNYRHSLTILSRRKRKTLLMFISSMMSQKRSTTSWMVFSHSPWNENY